MRGPDITLVKMEYGVAMMGTGADAEFQRRSRCRGSTCTYSGVLLIQHCIGFLLASLTNSIRLILDHPCLQSLTPSTPLLTQSHHTNYRRFELGKYRHIARKRINRPPSFHRLVVTEKVIGHSSSRQQHNNARAVLVGEPTYYDIPYQDLHPSHWSLSNGLIPLEVTWLQIPWNHHNPVLENGQASRFPLISLVKATIIAYDTTPYILFSNGVAG
jgi:hypothetical protein